MIGPDRRQMNVIILAVTMKKPAQNRLAQYSFARIIPTGEDRLKEGDNTMSGFRFFLVVSVMLVTVLDGPAAARESSRPVPESCRPSHGELLSSLYLMSLFPETARTGTMPEWNCRNVPEPVNLEDYRIHYKHVPVSPAELSGRYEWAASRDELQTSHRGHQAYVLVRKDTGTTYIACERDFGDIMVFLTWSRQADDRLPEILVPVIEFFIGPEGANRLRNAYGSRRIDEMIETAEWSYPESLNRGLPKLPERILAIRGTDFPNIPEIRTSLKDILGKSCIFDVMAHVVGRADRREKKRFIVSGHSLGGAVAQYVAQKHAGNNDGGNFCSYAFNAIGLREPERDMHNLISFVIDGDIVSSIGRGIGRRQGGYMVKYVPPSNWANRGPIALHELASVREDLCECGESRGSLVLDRVAESSCPKPVS